MSYVLPSRNLVSQNDSAMVERADVPRSKFTGSWSRKTTFDASFLVPFLVDEILPGDHMKYNVTAYVRLATPLFPIFDNQKVETFFFFVPNRLVWSNWVKMMGQQDTPSSSIAYTIPQRSWAATAANNSVGSLLDYFGCVVNGVPSLDNIYTVSALPFRAYNIIYNEWFRDENMQSAVVQLNDNGPDAGDNYPVLRRAKGHDYFTSALPWPQKFTAPTIAIGTAAPIVGLYGSTGVAVPFTGYTTGGSPVTTAGAFTSNTQTLAFDVANQPYADLSAATGITINAFRQAFLVQQLQERDARGGTRYTEIMRSHFGVVSPDMRLQRPEYIGGGSTPLMITPVAQTAPTSGVTVGALGAAGTATGQHSASYAATEHGHIIGLINVKSDISYQQGLHKMWTRQTRYDFYWPSLAGLGEQAVLRGEIYKSGVPATDNIVFGYQERWHEYRTHVSEVTGLFRSGLTGTLDAWHLAELFASAPVLGNTFVSDQGVNILDRVVAAGSLARTNFQQYLADILIQREAVRAMPMFGTPALLGRF